MNNNMNVNRRIFYLMLTTLIAIWAKAQQQITILHTNDTHSTIMPLSKNVDDTLLCDRGGFIRRMVMIEEERKSDPELLLLDSGDFSQGSSYYTLFKGDVEIGLMNRMHYDAATIGNHEFDFGLENMARLFAMADFPIVCANYNFEGTPVEGLVRPYVIIERGNISIGIFGLSPKLSGLVSNKMCEGVEFLDPIEKANEVATYLKDVEECDIVICLSHLGWSIAPELDDNQLIAKTRNIDVVLGGHSHTYLQKLEWVNNVDGVPVPVDQNGKHGIFVGKLVVSLE